ncbi:GntR family transcriptional regulator [Alicyclobacillus dauci]|uniref:GntR family transcriptional regulator n=1 Tax=Alicyclobacillus dauci TaxID=1475485 RepID=A0ABY6ZAY9_9BACL|nr:GntR family transcriptional regulator [Alicyclobacillus dauci]WAH36360.1 GntR family transcriptional regulator [Alicyclobacillus dauci]WAH39374.1 GntR family transcriptional regulator [Alicyclobacillus dauci]
MSVIQRSTREPLYLQIKRVLISRIAHMKENELFPSEHDLAAEFEVSRGTVKQAIVELVNEGYVYRIQGKGTFVSPPRIIRGSDGLPSFTDDIRRKGYVPVSTVRFIGLELPPASIQDKLNVPNSQPVWRIERVVTADGVPVALVTSYLRSDIYPSLDQHEVINNSLYQTLAEHYGRVPSYAKDTYQAQVASTTLAHVLSLHAGDAVLYSERLAFLDTGLLVEHVQSYMRGDRFIVQVQFPQEGDADESAVGIRPRDVRR